VRKALATLPWVEQASVQTIVSTREVRFNLTERDRFSEDEVRQALKDQNFPEMSVKTTKGRE
jgi:hypothetical protein